MPNLIGPSFDQVPTNGMLGGLAYQSPENVTIRNLELTNLSGHSSVVTGTAVDVFVYDTRKDSDGGAWRKRTQHTSWYNETLNTPTRGARREFPAVAVIVTEASRVVIYDADDPDMPMWMVFIGTGVWNQGLYFNGNTSGCVFALNGVVCWGDNNNAFVLTRVNFIADNTYINASNTNYGGQDTLPLSQRNSSGHTFLAGTGSLPVSVTIVNNYVNDVAMTVLPNAPIDNSTGLPVPTIAVATDGGASIIRENGNIANITFSTFNKVYRVGFLDNSRVYILNDDTSRRRFVHIYDIPTSTVTQATDGFRAGSSLEFYQTDLDGVLANLTGFNSNLYNADINGIANRNYGTTAGLMRVEPNLVSPSNGLVNITTTSYNTGWMHGNIRGAWLSDTSTASVTGTELVTNGDFSTSTLTTYTQLYNCSLSIVSNQLRVTSTSASGYCEFYIGVSDYTKSHYLTFQFVGASGITQFGIYASSTGYVTDTNAGWSSPSYTISRNAGTYTLLIPPGNGIVGFVFNIASLGQTWTFDNISLRPILELDRSVNNRGLQVFGTITKTPVATGSNLVAYSGFTSSNYLQQPYNSALDFGTGDFCVMGWAKPSQIGTVATFVSRYTNGSNSTGWNVSYHVDGTLYFYTVNSGNFTYGNTSGGPYVTVNVWQHLVFVRRNGVLLIFKDGILINSHTGAIRDVSNSSAVLRVSNEGTLGHGDPGSMSLWRISSSVPSPEQIRKIYEDEKALFQPNSQCTLFGSSDAITALAYDDTTRLLHVGTSSGRSVFQGLERVANTTLPVATAISASNGLVAED